MNKDRPRGGTWQGPVDMGSTFTFTLPSSGTPSGVPEQQSTNTAFGSNQIEGQTGTGITGLKGTAFEGLIPSPGASVQPPKTIEIKGPPGATYAQAKAIFEQQLNSGSLDQLKPGQDVNSLINSKGKSILGMAESFTGKSIGTGPLDGLTGGISNLGNLSGGALTNALKNPAIANAVEGFSSAGASVFGSNNSLLNATDTLSTIKNLSPSTMINVGDFSKAIPAISGIAGGAIDPNQTTGLLSQLKKSMVDDGSLSFGSFGISPESLQLGGALKPGVVDKYINNITPNVTSADLAEVESLAANGIDVSAEQLSIRRQATDILNSPTVWSGTGGANNLTSFLANEKLQSNITQVSMDKGLDQLKSQGLLTGTESPANLAGVSALCSKFDPATASDYLKGVVNPELKTQLDQIMRDSQFSINAVDQKIPDTIKGIVPAKVFSGTTLRSGIDVSSALLVPSDKVPSFKFGGGSGTPTNKGTATSLPLQSNSSSASTNTAFGSNQIEGQTGTGVAGLKGTPFGSFI
jgi:hypothetical protein